MEYIIDFSGICDAKSIHQTLARTLNFPDWYGHNLDALYDCLTESPDEVHLVIKNWDTGTPFSEGFQSVFENVQADNPDFTVQFT